VHWFGLPVDPHPTDHFATVIRFASLQTTSRPPPTRRSTRSCGSRRSRCVCIYIHIYSHRHIYICVCVCVFVNVYMCLCGWVRVLLWVWSIGSLWLCLALAGCLVWLHLSRPDEPCAHVHRHTDDTWTRLPATRTHRCQPTHPPTHPNTQTQDELLATRKDLIQGTLKHFRKACEACGDPKEALKVSQ
jgi:hypothetical protein